MALHCPQQYGRCHACTKQADACLSAAYCESFLGTQVFGRQWAPHWHKLSGVAQTADEEGRRKAQERFLRLKAAYEVLRDPAARREYDAGRSATAA